MHINDFYAYSNFKKNNSSSSRTPFFNIALKYARLAKRPNPTIADIGSGEGDFFIHLRDNNFSTENVFLLDSNHRTTEENKVNFTQKSLLYLAPDRLPFDDASVDLVHSSHMIEYLAPDQLYALMLEMNRVLADDGYIVLSAPLLWDNFYNDLGHLRPYNPMVFYKYFIEMYRNPRLAKVSDGYELQELAYRYHQIPLDEGWSSVWPPLDYLLISLRRLLGKLGIKKLYRNGYTLVLKKTKHK